MPPEQMQQQPNLPQEAEQDQMIIEFLQELEARITALEETVMPKEDEPKEVEIKIDGEMKPKAEE